MKIKMIEIVGDFAEDKDSAASLRERQIKPLVARHERVVLDFRGITLATQSFIHALISDVLRTNGEEALDFLEFQNCADVVRGIISTVVQYSLDSMSDVESLAAGVSVSSSSEKRHGRISRSRAAAKRKTHKTR